MESEALLTAGQVAKRLRISKPHAYKLLQNPESTGLSVIRIGKNIRVEPEALREFIRRGGCGCVLPHKKG